MNISPKIQKVTSKTHFPLADKSNAFSQRAYVNSVGF